MKISPQIRSRNNVTAVTHGGLRKFDRINEGQKLAGKSEGFYKEF
jgi:hypothetical protein